MNANDRLADGIFDAADDAVELVNNTVCVEDSSGDLPVTSEVLLYI